MRDWAGPRETLDAESYERLYRGALLLESKVERIRGATLTLLLGRLGLTLDEVLHLHEGWIDWGQGEIHVPEKDPCACESCWETARARREYTEPLIDVLYEECWSPSTRPPRTVPFGWSRRTTAALLTTYDRWEVLDLSHEDARKLLEAAGRKADSIAADDVTPDLLTASAARAFATLGLGRGPAGRMLGVPSELLAPFWNEAPDVTVALERLTGTADDEVAPAAALPVACGTGEYPAEPFDPDAGNVAIRQKRSERAADPDRIPRTTSTPGSVKYDRAEHARADGPSRGEDHPSGEADYTGSPNDVSGSAAPGTDIGGAADGSSLDVSSMDLPGFDESPSQPAPPDDSPSDDWPPEVESRAKKEAANESSPSSPRETVTQPVVADVSTRLAADEIAGGREFSGRVVLGQEEALVLQSEDDEPPGPDVPHVEVSYDAVWDVTIDQVPDRFDASFPRTVTLSYRPEGTDQYAVAVQLPPSQRADMAAALYRLLLNVTPVTVTDPARVAGRVTDAEPVPMVMYVRPGRVVFADEDGESARCSFELSDVVHVDRMERPIDGEERPVVEFRRVTGNRPVTTDVYTSHARLQRLIWRYVRSEYQQTLATVRALRLSDAEKMIMIALYSTDGSSDLGTILDIEERELAAALHSLQAKELVRATDSGPELTGKGQLAVSDRLDSVND